MKKLKNQVHKEKLEEITFLKKMTTSHFNYYFGYVSNISLVIWLSSHAFEGGQSLLAWYEWIYISALGLFLWTLVEYLMHKFPYHVWKSAFEKGHRLHHERPYDLMGVPWYITLVIVVGIYFGLSQFVNPARLSLSMAAIWLGYIGYCVTHHAIHHWKLDNKLFKKLKKHHYIHHARHDKNIGMVTTFWDVVFGTLEKK
jgi:sterol desaturase/sphingolipid hydroxylase (fatty acid hydroxylase superfamily)